METQTIHNPASMQCTKFFLVHNSKNGRVAILQRNIGRHGAGWYTPVFVHRGQKPLYDA